MLRVLFLFLVTAQLAFSQECPPHISQEVWQKVEPFFLPDNSPIKQKLDQIFSASRATASRETLAAAGFHFPGEEGHHVAAVSHPSLPGYFLKIYPDYNERECEWQKWLQRIEGAAVIRRWMELNPRYASYFKVPKKWIYVLPANPPPPEGDLYIRKNFILVVENVYPLNRKENHERWRMKTELKHLKAFYKLVTDCGLRDSCRVANAPWCKEKKIAFVDTEYYNQWPVNYHPLLQYLNTANRHHWRNITGSNW